MGYADRTSIVTVKTDWSSLHSRNKKHIVQFVSAQQFPTNTAAPGPAPTFANTPGVQVQSPTSRGFAIRPNGLLPISFTLGRRPISSALVTMAKSDGSGNTTILDIKTPFTFRVVSSVDLTPFKFPEGEYIFNLVIAPNTTMTIPTYTTPTSSGALASATATATAVPQPTGVPVNTPEFYYWRTSIILSKDAPITRGNNDTNSGSMNFIAGAGVGITGAWTTFVNMLMALTILAFVNMIVL
ncbi:hypothetical protein FBU30_009867 [Linnemannia zychae]|nr:hypothetical protein FBU30_009867 [Linnemannia zychae]